MISFSFFKSNSIRQRFDVILGLVILILLFWLLNFWFSIQVMSGVRAYVGGEGLWSKAQKEAVTNLVRYTSTHDESYYQKYLDLTRVQAGDKQARLQLDKAAPNYALVRQGFVQGGNNPADVDDMVFLYRNFRNVSFMSAAIATWQQGDAEIARLSELAQSMHTQVAMQAVTVNQQTRQNQELSASLSQMYSIDARLTILENRFSATLGDGSRYVSNLLLLLTIVTSGLLGALTLVIAVLIAKTIIHLDTLKSEFVSLASHQLRTPLTAINWYTEELLGESKGKLTAAQRSYLTELYNGGKRMSSLIGDLLRVSSLELGTYKPRLTRKSVNEILQTAVNDLQARLNAKHLTLQVDVAADLPIINVDDQMLTVTFQNLLSNSVKYTPNGGKIAVRTWRDKDNLVIHVSDTGIGIPRSQQSQIFTQLFRADNAKQVDSESSGLGLYIVKAAAERIGGTIRFTSVEGKGSDFYITLPIYRRLHVRHTN